MYDANVDPLVVFSPWHNCQFTRVFQPLFIHMKVIITVLESSIPASVVGVMDILRHARSFYSHLHPENPDMEIFDVKLMSVSDEKTVLSSGFPLVCQTSISELPIADIVIVPALVGDLQAIIQENQALIQWLTDQYKSGTALVSTCTGAFILAATGLLNGKEATTSWFSADAFRLMFPDVILLDEKIIVDNGNMVTGGATLSFMNLCIYLIEKYFGLELGNYCAKMFLVDKGRSSQQSYAIFSLQKIHKDNEIRKVQEWLEKNPEEKLVVSDLAQLFGISERNLIRRFKAATGNTLSDYFHRVKVEKAKQLLEEGRENIKEITFRSGYDDPEHFRGIFKRHTGLTLAGYRKMFLFNLTT